MKGILEELTGSKTRAGALEALFDGRIASLGLNELSHRIGVTPMAARRELLKLVALHAVTCSRNGGRTLYAANPAYPFYTTLRQLVARKTAATDRVAETVAPYSAPACHIVAGPNGSGKSTFALEFLPGYAPGIEYVNPDLMAQGLSPTDISLSALQAGRLVFERIDALSAQLADFGFETTLSGTVYLRKLSALKESGYQINLYYLWISQVGILPPRIRHRVQAGGHNVPDADVLRRFERSRLNLARYLPLVDHLLVFNATPTVPVLIYERERDEKILDPGLCPLMKKELGL